MSTAPLLTYDAQKASEAAFHGRPLDPTWSKHAQDIYHRILGITKGRALVSDGVQSQDRSMASEEPC